MQATVHSGKIKTVLHSYSFYDDDPKQAEAYRQLRAKLEADKDRRFFHVNADDSADRKEPPAGPIELETNFLFADQWNTAPCKGSVNGFRVFDWYEGIWPNRHLHRGHYLEITEEMRAIRRNTLQCGYCGSFYKREGAPVFCEHCLDSPYLKEADLYLLRLRPISDGRAVSRQPLTDDERAALLPRYVERQLAGKTIREERRAKKEREDIQHEYEVNRDNNEAEYKGKLWLLDHRIDLENVIYYNHTGKFCFGWRSPVSPSVKSALLDVLTEFPYDYEIESVE